jgi:hypothetical protein
MRAGPLSDDSFIRLLNTYYVPFYATWKDYMDARNGVSLEECGLFHRMMDAFYKTKFSTGSVHVYIFTGDLTPLGSMHVASAMKKELLKPFLNSFVVSRNVLGGDPLFPLRKQSVPPSAPKDALVLHDVMLGISDMREFPHENYTTFTSAEQAQLLPPARSASAGSCEVPPGTSWKLDPKVAFRFAEHFHPSLVWNSPEEAQYTAKLENLDLTATVLPSGEGQCVAKLEGKFKMLRTCFSIDLSQSTATANLVGYMRFNAGRIQSLELVVKDAFYGKVEFEGYVEAVHGGAGPDLKTRMVSENTGSGRVH